MKIKKIYLQAFVVWLIYTIVTKGTFVEGMAKSIKGLDAYLLNIFFSILFGVLFLYLFNHEDFFKFAKEIEKENKKKEKKLEHRLLHFGRFFFSNINRNFGRTVNRGFGGSFYFK